ncbi:sulfite exporter TauE/SafE family protein [Paenibacillus sediminis]|uniref:Probable membrane transporter protein n=1 Tax=Paenibacillus sediminis TaxID=664909 RepID=A0ABS4H6L7_9BACL|nr:sulfite exporter TauE/SafE family protein [Paenibacillus sediminis]MBP1938007.1 putative membrane protein YfcA [Paenibacillus sediminis]
MITSILVLIAIGLVASTFGAIVGLGGGIIIVPSLVYLGPLLLDANISTSRAVGTSLTVLIFTALSSTLSFMKKKRVDFKTGWLLFITSGPASMIGAALTSHMKSSSFEIIFGIFMFLMALLMILRDKLKPAKINWKIKRTFTDEQGQQMTYGYNLLPALLIGFFVGLVSGLFGIGGGSLFVPLMVLLFRFPPHVATATSMFVIFLSSILGSSIHGFEGDVDGYLVLVLAPSAWIGGKLGAMIASRMSGKGLLWLLRITLVLFSINMIISGVRSM